jgi:hypothetical protein
LYRSDLKLLYCSSKLENNEIRHSGVIRCIAIDRIYDSDSTKLLRFATLGDDKRLSLWHFDLSNNNLTNVQSIVMKKKLVSCVFGGANHASLVVGDKFGDGFLFPVGSTANTDVESFEKQEDAEFGQLSTLITMVCSHVLFFFF